MPRIDTSGGNVTHAAVSLARALGARHIAVFGADFSYPEGKAYARGTYLYDYFWTEQNRFSPAEGRFYSFVHSSALTRREVHGDRILYTNPLLRSYRERFLGLIETIDADVTVEPGAGLDTVPRQKKVPAQMSAASDWYLQPSHHPRCGWRQFLSEYARSVEHLPTVDHLAEGNEGELWSTILPVAARVVREGVAPGPGALEEARRWILERIRTVLQSPDDSPRA
jgi:hypothetical protein